MRRTPIAAFATALTVTIAVGLQIPAAIADDSVALDPINNPATASSQQSGLVFLTQDPNAKAADVFTWYPSAGQVIDANMVSTTLSPPSLHPNAVGFRTADGFIYGIESTQSTKGGTLVQIGLVGGVYTAVPLGVPTTSDGTKSLKADKNSNPTEFDAGTFGSGATADVMYLLAYGGDVLYELDFSHLQGAGCDAALPGIVNATCLPTLTVVDLLMPAGSPKPELADVADLFWLGGALFGVYQYDCSGGSKDCEAHIYRINVDTAGVTKTGPVAVDDFTMDDQVAKADFSEHGYGSQWVYPNGDFGFATNSSTQVVYRCAMAKPGDPADLGITCVAQADGPVGHNNPNDGTSNGIASVISVRKTADLTSARVDDTVTYTLVVTAVSGNATGWVLDDTIPPTAAGSATGLVVTNVVPAPGSGSSSAQCTVTGTSLHCFTIGGPLLVDHSVTITYTAKVKGFNDQCKLVNDVVVKAFAPAKYAYNAATVNGLGCEHAREAMDVGVTSKVRDITTSPGGAYAASTTASAGDLVQFQMIVDDGITGPSNVEASSWTLRDVIPAGLEMLNTPVISTDWTASDVTTGASCDPWSPTTSPSTLRCGGEALPVGADVIITFTARVAAGAPAVIDTAATVAPAAAQRGLDNDTANELASAKVTLKAMGGTTSGPSTPAQHTASTGGSVPGGSLFAAGTLFVLAAGLGTWLVWSRRRLVAL